MITRGCVPSPRPVLATPLSATSADGDVEAEQPANAATRIRHGFAGPKGIVVMSTRPKDPKRVLRWQDRRVGHVLERRHWRVAIGMDAELGGDTPGLPWRRRTSCWHLD